MSSSRIVCCIRGCSNTPRWSHEGDPVFKFYRFPDSTIDSVYITKKRKQWINAVKNYVKTPKDWELTKNMRICSGDFINNSKSENPLRPSYIPTIFPGKENLKRSNQGLQRFKRVQQRQSRTTINTEELIVPSSSNNNNYNT